MATTIETDLCIIGAGSGGLSVAAGAVQMGARTVLIERDKMGGDCLNHGCVPSKSLIAAATAAKAFRHDPFTGAKTPDYRPDFQDIRRHIRSVISTIEPHDSVERFEGLGVNVIKGQGTFSDPQNVSVGDQTIRAKRFVIATGSRAAIPPIPGIDSVPFLTNETIFELSELPSHLLVIGGGPIGCELAQAFRRLGAEVTILDLGPILAKDDPELTDTVRESLRNDGVRILENSKLLKIDAGPVVTYERNGATAQVGGSHLLVAAGRRPNVEGLGLEDAAIEFSPRGISVDKRLRTNQRHIFAIGDVAGGLQFTHVAGYHAGILIRNTLFRIPAKVSYNAMPWVTFTSPELAHVGLNQSEAEQQGIKHQIVTWPYTQNDRAIAEGKTTGQIKIILRPNGRILGASIVGAQAGELIFPWCLAIERKLSISAMAGTVAPYPTLSELSKRAAGAFYSPKLFSDRTRGLVRFLLKLPF